MREKWHRSRSRRDLCREQRSFKGLLYFQQLGEVVLVKNVKSLPGTPVVPKEQIPAKGSQEPVTPEKEELKPPKSTISGEDVKLPKEKIESVKDEKEKIKTDSQKVGENDKDDKEGPVKADEKDEADKTGKKRLSPRENGIDVQKIADEVDKAHSLENKFSNLKWTAEKVVTPGSKVAINDFSRVACYIPPHITKKHFVANMSKNRFADVICLDHSRVKLTDSSYIHANWVDSSVHGKAILTQFPLPNTASDFWQMVIDHKVKCVLLIMTDQEYKHFGGDFVFPQNQDFLSFDDRSIRVGEFKQTELGKGWNMKVISVTNGNYKAFIHVHHYKNWLHNAAPIDSKQIWQLQSYLQKYTNPPVYMSLSGCGRAGTWALFESANASLNNEQPSFNMIKSLENIRHGRLHSVQTLPQFSFVYSMISDKILGNAPTVDSGKDQESSTAAILRQLTIQ